MFGVRTKVFLAHDEILIETGTGRHRGWISDAGPFNWPLDTFPETVHYVRVPNEVVDHGVSSLTVSRRVS